MTKGKGACYFVFKVKYLITGWLLCPENRDGYVTGQRMYRFWFRIWFTTNHDHWIEPCNPIVHCFLIMVNGFTSWNRIWLHSWISRKLLIRQSTVKDIKQLRSIVILHKFKMEISKVRFYQMEKSLTILRKTKCERGIIPAKSAERNWIFSVSQK